MQKLLLLVSFLVLTSTFSASSPILLGKDAKQVLRSRREGRPRKAGFPDEPMRSCFRQEACAAAGSKTCIFEDFKNEYMLHLQRLEQRSEEQFLEHWLNPYCLPHCNRDLVHPV